MSAVEKMSDHTGGTATCKDRATCTICGQKYGDLAAHNYKTTWSTDSAKHWHECSVCGGNKKDVAAHTPGAPATETTPQTCTICGICHEKPHLVIRITSIRRIRAKHTSSPPQPARKRQFTITPAPAAKKERKPLNPATSRLTTIRPSGRRTAQSTGMSAPSAETRKTKRLIHPVRRRQRQRLRPVRLAAM